MTLDTIITENPAWQSASDAENADTVVLSLCNVGRNLRDIPFPGACSAADREVVEERMRDVFENMGLLAEGSYFRLPELKPAERQILAERLLVSPGATSPRKGQAVYIARDQGLSILVNDEDHCCIRVVREGLNLQEAWRRASALDDRLNDVLDFAYSEQFGYLTRSLDHAGTGLKLGLLLHLPACAYDAVVNDSALLETIRAHAEEQELDLSGVGAGMPEKLPGRPTAEKKDLELFKQSLYSGMNGFAVRGLNETDGDLFQLTNRTTLGHSEEELIFRLKQGAKEIIRKEFELRDTLRSQHADVLEDRIERARALATSARLIPFEESLSLLSSLRLGVSLGFITAHTVAELNRSLIHCQGAHIERQVQPDSDTADDLHRKRLRARQFRQLFTPAQDG